MTGHIALTDFNWYSFLESHGPWDEINFWQPGSTLLNPPPNHPFFFKLHAPHGGFIVGYGCFSWRSRLPAWIVWDSFGPANGAADRETFIRLLCERKGISFDPRGSFEIGCLLIERPVFFPRGMWVQPPGDWPTSGVQQGKGYNLDAGEGLRVLSECLERRDKLRAQRDCLDRVGAYPAEVAPAEGSVLHSDRLQDRYGTPYAVRPRLGQGGFRVAVTDAYERACAVSTEHSLPVLEAAHVKPFALGGTHEIQNGILLRADIHRLFDQGLVTVTDDYRFRVSDRLRTDYKNGRVYYALQQEIERAGRIHLPKDIAMHPSPELLRWHMTERFVA